MFTKIINKIFLLHDGELIMKIYLGIIVFLLILFTAVFLTP